MAFGNFWFRKGDDSIKRITDILDSEESIDITPSIKEACDLLREIADVFDVLFEPIRAYESTLSQEKAIAEYKARQKEMQEKFEFIRIELDKLMPRIERSLRNLTWESGETGYIDANKAAVFIRDSNRIVPIIQDGFDDLGAQSINFMQSINDLIEILNTKNKTLPKQPNIPLRLIQKLINHFHRK